MNKSVVIAFGRFNPPTTGHARLIERVSDEAGRLHADMCVFPSPTKDAKRNPLPFREKIRFLKMLFPKMMFSENANIKNPFDALYVLSKMGYTRVAIVCGSDQTEEFRRIAKYIRKPKQDRRYIELQPVKKTKDDDEKTKKSEKPQFVEVVATRKAKSDEKHIVLQDYVVLPLQREDMSTLSATIMRSAAEVGNFLTFRRGLPTRNEGIARQLFTSVRRHMGLDTTNEDIRKIRNGSRSAAKDEAAHGSGPSEAAAKV
jgi:cytidyltransferase-like protein